MAVQIGVLGNYGHHNNGDEAILWGILEQLAAWPEKPRVTVFSFDPADTRNRHPQVDAVPILQRRGSRVAMWPTLRALYRQLRRLDLLIIGGGALLMDTFRNQALLYTGIARLARLAGVPVVYHAVGAGPIETGLGRWLIRASANQAASVSVRDSESQALLRSIGVRKPIQVVADPAFGLKGEAGADEGRGDSPLLPPRRDGWLRVGISALPCYYPGLASDGDPARYRAYVEGMRQLAQGILAAEGAEVVFFGTKYPQDVETAREILDGLQDGVQDGRVQLLDRELSPQALIRLMHELDVLIATRLHALILATVAGTPSLGIAYRSKVRAIFEDNGRGQWVVSPEEPQWPQQMLAKWQEMTGRLNEEREAVRQMAAANREAAQRQLAGLSRLLRKGGGG